MAIDKIQIEKFIELSEHHLVIDVRSAGEYNHAHIPGAYSLPLFTNEERIIVGTTYKQQSREAAIKVGLDFFGPKMRRMVEEVELLVGSRESGVNTNKIEQSVTKEPTLNSRLLTPASRIGESGFRDTSTNSKLLIPNSKILLIYCWRGGMRSAGVAWLMDLYGFKVYTLIGGYKKFRNYVLETFKLPFQFSILAGFTGSGKTKVLKELNKYGETIIDLEDVAKHKGSAFGSIGMPKQPTQEMFENLLAVRLRAAGCRHPQSLLDSREVEITTNYKPQTNPIWLEDESQRIGLVNIPAEIWKKMRESPVHFLDIPFEERLNYLVNEYGTLDKEKMKDAIIRIQKRLGGLESKNALVHLEQNNLKECFRILLKYYDKFYLKGLHNRGNIKTLLKMIKCLQVSTDNALNLLDQPLTHEIR